MVGITGQKSKIYPECEISKLGSLQDSNELLHLIQITGAWRLEETLSQMLLCILLLEFSGVNKYCSIKDKKSR